MKHRLSIVQIINVLEDVSKFVSNLFQKKWQQIRNLFGDDIDYTIFHTYSTIKIISYDNTTEEIYTQGEAKHPSAP